MNLKGKVCLVTGGSSGIGAATALTLALKGAHIAVVARKAVPMPDSLLAAVKAHGTTARFVKVDVADPESCRKCVEAGSERLRPPGCSGAFGGRAGSGWFLCGDG